MKPKLPKQNLERVDWRQCPLSIPLDQQKGRGLFRVVPPDGKSLFTGYFAPVLKGSLQRQGAFQHPLYRPPSDLVSKPNIAASGQPGMRMWGREQDGKIIPHFTREEIENGALKDKNLELLFVDDPADLFFLHVQGSGIIELPDGSKRRVTFKGKNGHAYTAIGAVLREQQKLAPITMQTIKAWLRTNPEKAQSILNHNASFIFFDFLEGSAPVGASGLALQPEESLAIDDTLWPYGIEVIVETTHPLKPSEPFIRRMITADTGSAIRGLVRGDIYFGEGQEAGQRAGSMNAPGTLWIILPNA